MRWFESVGWIASAALLFFWALSIARPASGLPQDVQQIVRTVEARYHSSHTLKAVFLERYNEGRLTARVESGTAYFSRPGRMRWEYESPEQKLFLTDGKTAWFYVPSDHTVTRAAMKESEDWRTPLSLLTGKVNLSRFCKRIELADIAHPDASTVTLRCLPAGASGQGADEGAGNSQSGQSETVVPGTAGAIRDVLIEVDPKTGWLASVAIQQAGGVELEYRFGKWEENLDLPEAMFHFSAPKGVAIVEEGASGSSASY